MINEQKLSQDVMRRVRFIYAVRTAFSPEALKGLVFAVSMVTFFVITHIASIIENMSNLPSLLSYIEYVLFAYTHTTVVIQATIVLAIVAGIWLVVDAVRNFRISGRGLMFRRA